jgi:hypothetical protein
MYFDNVGGIHFEAAMMALAPHGRVAVCGGISKYNNGERSAERFFPTDMIYTFQRVEVCLRFNPVHLPARMCVYPVHGSLPRVPSHACVLHLSARMCVWNGCCLCSQSGTLSQGFMCAPWLTGKKGNFHQEMAKCVPLLAPALDLLLVWARPVLPTMCRN